MYKAIGSNRSICENSQHSGDYYESVRDIIEQEEITDLDNYCQHLNTSRLQHSINVSYYSYKIARFFGLDGKSAARAGLMHDMYYYEYSESSLSCVAHSKLHSELALENARKITELNSLEEDIILTHMWPITKKAPRHPEGFVVTTADKFCAVMEVFVKIPGYLKSKAIFKLYPQQNLKTHV